MHNNWNGKNHCSDVLCWKQFETNELSEWVSLESEKNYFFMKSSFTCFEALSTAADEVWLLSLCIDVEVSVAVGQLNNEKILF